MKKLIFLQSNRAHVRNQLLLKRLRQFFKVHICTYGEKDTMSIVEIAVDITSKLKVAIDEIKPDVALIRADRAEMLPMAMLCAYSGIPIVHIEGGSETGQKVIDSRVRHAITKLSDIHLVTDEEARRNVILMGGDPDRVFNIGSLDVSYATQVKTKDLIGEPYVLVLHHSIPEEDSELVFEAVKEATNLKMISAKSNNDYKKSIIQEEHSQNDFISLLKHAQCFISNSSAACKEASILGTPVCLVGTRQDGRLVGHNVIRVPHDKEEIIKATRYQISHGAYRSDDVYYKSNSEELACSIIENFVYCR